MPAEESRSRAMGMDMEELPKNMSLSALADRCMSEINHYRRGEASSDQYCLESTILDMLRSYARTKEVPLPEPGFAGEPAMEDQYEGSELWEVIRTMLPSEREQRLAFYLYQCNLKPREIVRLRPQEFSNVDE